MGMKLDYTEEEMKQLRKEHEPDLHYHYLGDNTPIAHENISQSMRPKLYEPQRQFDGTREKRYLRDDIKEYLDYVSKKSGEDCSAKFDYVYDTLPTVVDGKAFRVLICYILAQRGIIIPTECWQSQW